MCAATVATFGTSGLAHMNVKADTKAPAPNLQMLQATDLNLKQRIMELKHHRHVSNANRAQLASLRTQDANVESQITSIQAEQQSEAAARSAAAASQAAAQSAAASSAAASSAAASSAAASLAAAQSAAASSQAAAQSAAASSQAAAQSAANAASQTAAQSNSTPTPSSSASSDGSGLNMNQTSGTVDVNALGAYLASHKGIYSAEKWARIIYRESNGRVDAQNASSGAYGVLQLLGHGEYRGMTLGAQLQMAMPLPASAWAETNY